MFSYAIMPFLLFHFPNSHRRFDWFFAHSHISIRQLYIKVFIIWILRNLIYRCLTLIYWSIDASRWFIDLLIRPLDLLIYWSVSLIYWFVPLIYWSIDASHWSIDPSRWFIDLLMCYVCVMHVMWYGFSSSFLFFLLDSIAFLFPFFPLCISSQSFFIFFKLFHFHDVFLIRVQICILSLIFKKSFRLFKTNFTGFGSFIDLHVFQVIPFVFHSFIPPNFIHPSFDWLIDQVSEWSIDLLIDWVGDWFIDWVIDWLIDWFSIPFFFRPFSVHRNCFPLRWCGRPFSGAIPWTICCRTCTSPPARHSW